MKIKIEELKAELDSFRTGSEDHGWKQIPYWFENDFISCVRIDSSNHWISYSLKQMENQWGIIYRKKKDFPSYVIQNIQRLQSVCGMKNTPVLKGENAGCNGFRFYGMKKHPNTVIARRVLDYIFQESNEPVPRIDYSYLEGKTIKHKVFGLGLISRVQNGGSAQDTSLIYAQFGETEKCFTVPDAFEKGFLTIVEPTNESNTSVHGWTYEEEFVLCQLYLDHRYGRLSELTDEELIVEATRRLSDISAEDAKDGFKFIDALMEREDEEIDEDDPEDELLLKKVLGHALKDFVKTELKDKRK